MSAQIIISQPEADEGFGLLKDIVAMVKNPKIIDEAYARRSEAVKLNEEEIKKAESDRSLMAKADDLRVELQKKEDDIAEIKKKHEDAVSKHGENVKANNARLTEWETRLNTVTAQQVETSRKQLDKEAEFDVRMKEAEKVQKARELDLQRREEVVAQVDEAQKLESDRLIAEDKRLKQKAARIAAEASKD